MSVGCPTERYEAEDWDGSGSVLAPRKTGQRFRCALFVVTTGFEVASLGLDGVWEHRWAAPLIAESLEFEFRLFEIVSGTVHSSWRPFGRPITSTPPSEVGTGHSRLRSADPVSSKAIFL